MNSLVFVVAFVAIAVSGQRVAPGVPPQHYQQNAGSPPIHQGGHPDPHQQQMQYQQQQQQEYHQQQAYQQQQHQQQQQVEGRVPPGVHPGQYQQQQQQQQYQQQQYQQQPPQQHQQNVPQQHHQQPPQHHQQPPQPHGQHPPHHQPQVLNPGNIQHEREHIAEHAEVPIDTSKMSEQELQFHYFKMHDADSNNKLDGCELIKSLIHYHEQGSKESHNHGADPDAQRVEEKIFSDEELVALIDPILQMDDINKDGFIDYPEFIRAQQKAAQKH